MSVVSPDTDSLLALLDRRIAVLRMQRPELDEALVLQHRVITTQLNSPRAPQVAAFALPRQQLAERVREGVPLLHGQPALVDVQFAADLLERLVLALSPRFDSLAGAIPSGRVDPEQLFGEAFVQHADHLGQIAEAADLEAGPLSAAATLAVAPLLRAYAARLTPLLSPVEDNVGDERSTQVIGTWTHGYCPICGNWPLLGELRGADLVAWLRCGGCGSGWQVQSGACPFCGNADERQLGTLTVDGEARFRAVFCQRCAIYLKVANALEPPPAEVLALGDVVSLQLDMLAAERGYRRPSGNGYRIELAIPDSDWLEELA
jgi:FdhE protein